MRRICAFTATPRPKLIGATYRSLYPAEDFAA